MKRLLRLVVLLVLLTVAVEAARVFLADALQAAGPATDAKTLLFAKGTRTQDIGDALYQAGVIASRRLWPVLVKISGRQPLLAGEYEFPAHAAPATILDMMRRGQVVVHRLTIAEGLTVRQIEALLRQAPGADGRIDSTPSEGSLLPSTYFYSYGEGREALLARMRKGMTDLEDEVWPQRAPDLPFTSKDEALVLASIVERETALSAERPHIAAIFLNRLKLHMRLQSDPTVIYAVSQGEGVLDRPLSHADLIAANPYNTYANEGLPPGPICNPGRASVLAVLHPAVSGDLYFVADGSGGHVFAQTLAAHNQNVSHLRQIEQRIQPHPLQNK